MKKKIVFMFSGQGSQYYHMGKELYQNNPRFKLWMDYCDEIVRPLINESIITVIYQDGIEKSEPFDRILYTNPALISIEYSLARLLMEMNIQPDFVLGYSLGEITAAITAGAITLEEGLQFVIDFAKMIEIKGQAARMLTIIESPDIMLRFFDLFQNCWLTGKNFQNNFVVSGLKKNILYLQKSLDEKEILSMILPVNYGFHTPLMEPFEEKIKHFMLKINICPIRVSMVSSRKAKEIHEISDDFFYEVIRYPVEFEKTIRSMIKEQDYIFIDVGPSGSLATFVKYILCPHSNSLPLEMMNQFGKNMDMIERLRKSLLKD